IPVLVGMGAMYFLYVLIMLGNDGKLVLSELAGLAVCLCILLGMAAVYGVVYCYTVRRMYRALSL
ncbi:MAG: hypothetical protein K2P39_14230, partial [Lachnospiraceae bacterium]|nr:hypothetical protein [Lachnospiraceae bacterium]